MSQKNRTVIDKSVTRKVEKQDAAEDKDNE